MQKDQSLIQPVAILKLRDLPEAKPRHARVLETDLVVIRMGESISVLYGRCHHRGALLGDGHIHGRNLICGLHGWDYRWDTGVSEYNPEEVLDQFRHEIRDGELYVDLLEIQEFEKDHPSPFRTGEYQGLYADTHPQATEPHTAEIRALAETGLKQTGHHGPVAAMGVERQTLPGWDRIQFLPAQLWKRPLMDAEQVEPSVVLGPRAKKPLVLDIPLFVSDMSFGALSREAKIALARGAELAGTGICSGEGGMLDAEQEANSRYLYELASGRFGFAWEKVAKVQAFHFKAGQGAKTGTGGHLPGHKVTEEIARVRGLEPGEPAISPAAFPELRSVGDFRKFAEQVRETTGGIPVGFKMAASHLERDLAFALEADADYIILDGRGGGTGAAPRILRDHINIPTIPALARARRFLDTQGVKDVSLVITGGLRVAADFAKALMLGADAVAVANSALQAIGCLGMRACDTDNCPVGIATQKPHLRERLIVEESAQRLARFLGASTELMGVIARACGYSAFREFNPGDLSTFDREMHELTGIAWAGDPVAPR